MHEICFWWGGYSLSNKIQNDFLLVIYLNIVTLIKV